MTIARPEQRGAILLCGHGSRSPAAVTEFYTLLEKLKKRRPDRYVTAAFLEFVQPSLTAGLDHIYNLGIRDIIVQPLTLYHGDHSLRDIPAILADFQARKPDAHLRYGSSLGVSPGVAEAAFHALTPFLSGHADNRILVVGRGSEERRIADQTIKLCQKLHQKLPLCHPGYCYVHGHSPHLADALSQAAHGHTSRVIILPFLLFSGRILAEIYHQVDAAARKYPACQFDKAPTLGSCDALIEAVLYRIDNAC